MSLTSYILKLRNSIKTGIYSVSATVLRNKCLNRIDFPTPPETNCQGLFNQIHKKSTKKVPEAPYGS